ncbi:MAG: DNA polymerase III subunit gamma/tau [Opitutaceae bacterium]|nr:DNA polymerase III subunit gamma/tau [Opitutaceae bacterium]
MNSPSTPPLQVLDKAITKGRLAHSLLIYGQNFLALEDLAIHLGNRLLQIGENQSPLSHPDFFTLRPAKKMRQILAEDTREMIRKIQHSPQAGDHKMAVVFEADRMNQSAANIFLKALEEPPLNTTILLLTTRPYSLLPTIRSRCLLFRVPGSPHALENEKAIQWQKDYRQWLDDTVSGLSDKSLICRQVMALYGLVAQFSNILEEVTKEILAQKEEGKNSALSSDEKAALEAGISVSVRQQFFSEIETSTMNFARALHEETGLEPRQQLVSSIASLEHSSGLLRYNFNVNSALEIFLLTSMRIWASLKKP